MGLLALLVALAGTSYAAVNLPARSVGTRQLKARSVTAKKIRTGAVGTAAVADGSLQAADLGTGVAPLGSAGGDLAGTYPSPVVRPDAVDSSKVADNALTGTDVDESTLSGVNAETVGGIPATGIAGIGRATDPSLCDDDIHNVGGEVCGSLAITLPRPARLLVILSGTFKAVVLDDLAGPGSATDNSSLVRGNCTVLVDGASTQVEPGSQLFTMSALDAFSAATVVGPVAAGTRTVTANCIEEDGDIDFLDISVAAVALAAD